MENKHQVHNLIILDESGSMESIKNTIVAGFNEIVQSIKGIEKQFPEQEHFITLISFNSMGNKVLHYIDPVSKLSQINDKQYKPDAMTPLYDAIGFGINKMVQHLIELDAEFNVLATILTDGEENASKEYSGKKIKSLIEGLKQDRWTFTYIGTDHDVEKTASNLSINNIMRFEKNEADMKRWVAEEQNSRMLYSLKIRNKENLSDNFYEEKDNQQ